MSKTGFYEVIPEPENWEETAKTAQTVLDEVIPETCMF